MLDQTTHPSRVYRLRISTLAAVDITLADETQLIVVNNPPQRRFYNPEVKIKIYEQANRVIEGLAAGIYSKRRLAELCGSNIDTICCILKFLWQKNKIEDYHLDRHNVIPKCLEPFDLSILRFGMEWRQVKDIKAGDYVACINPEINRMPIIVDIAQFLARFPATEKYVYVSGNIKNDLFTPNIYEWIEENGPPEFAYGERKRFLNEKNWSVGAYDAAQNCIRKKTIVRIPRFLEISSEFAFAMGLYLAEGSRTTPGFYYALNISEQNLFDRAASALNEVVPNANCYFKQVDGTNGARGFFNNIPMAILMEKLLGKGAHNKHIPDFFVNAPDNIVLRLIEGYASGDGYSAVDAPSVTKKSSKKLQRVSIRSCHLELLLQVRQLMLRFGVVAGIYKRKERTSTIKGKPVNGGVSYELIIIGDQGCKMSQLLWGKFEGEETGRSTKLSFFLGDYVCLRLRNISLVKDHKLDSDLADPNLLKFGLKVILKTDHSVGAKVDGPDKMNAKVDAMDKQPSCPSWLSQWFVKHKSINTREAMILYGLSKAGTNKRLKELVKNNIIVLVGYGKNAMYIPKLLGNE